MNPTHNAWYSDNALRPYPLDDAASGVDDTGAELPDDVIVDAGVAWAFGSAALYVSALSCGPAGSSLVVSVGASIVASVSLTTLVDKPTRLLSPEGVEVGHVVFGRGARARIGSWRFSGPAQSRLAARTLRAYRPTGLSGVGRPNEVNPLTGLVRVEAGSDLSVSVGTRVVDGSPVRAVVVGLAEAPASDLFEKYVGDCGRRPESGNCTVKPIEYVRSVPPDCDGDLKLVFRPPFTYMTETGRITVGLGFSLESTCDRGLPAPNGDLPGRGGSFPPPVPPPPVPPPPDEPDPVPVSSVGFDCEVLPYCGQAGDGLWQDVRGVWSPGTRFDRPDCPGGSASIGSSSSVGGRPVVTGSPTIGRAVSLWYDCAYDGTAGRSVEAAVSVALSGGRAGVVVGYQPGGGERYVTAEVDAQTGSLRVRRWNGLGYTEIGVSGSFAVTVGDWYVVRVTVSGPPGGPVTLTAVASGVGGPPLGSVVTTLSSWPGGDIAGVCCHGSDADFGYFSME